jgi:hypothetical protein
MKILLFIFILNNTNFFRSDTEPVLGNKIDVTNLAEVYIVVSPSEIRKCYDITIDGINYSVSVNELSLIDYIITSDSNFSTTENLKIGDTYNKVQKLTQNKVVVLDGWGYYIELPSSWKAVFTQGDEMTEGELKNNSKVLLFFKQ